MHEEKCHFLAFQTYKNAWKEVWNRNMYLTYIYDIAMTFQNSGKSTAGKLKPRHAARYQNSSCVSQNSSAKFSHLLLQLLLFHADMFFSVESALLVNFKHATLLNLISPSYFENTIEYSVYESLDLHISGIFLVRSDVNVRRIEFEN